MRSRNANTKLFSIALAHLAIVVATLPALVGGACSSDNTAGQSSLLEGDDVVLAKVGQETITKYDVERAVISKFGPATRRQLEEKHMKEVLKSLVISKAISQKREKELKKNEHAAIEKEVSAAREELLVRQYLALHAQIEKASEEQLKKFYAENQAMFGARETKKYEMLASRRSLVPKEKDQLLKELDRAADDKDWSGLAERLRGKNFPIQYRKGLLAEDMLHKKLSSLIAGLNVGQTSKLTFIEGRAYLVRVFGMSVKSARPFGEVKDEIAEKLRSVQIKKAIMGVSEKVLKDVEVTYY